MAASAHDGGRDEAVRGMRRRGLLAAAAALVAGLAARATGETPVGAANGDTLTVGYFSTFGNTDPTGWATVNNSAPPFGMLYIQNTGQADAIRGQIASGGTAGTAGVRGEILPGSLGSGVVGTFGTSAPLTSSNNGVFGFATATNTGVHGISTGNGNGVFGSATGSAGLLGSFGVWGTTDVGVGVAGSATSATGTGVYGRGSAGTGVVGQSLGASYGVQGISQLGVGISGASNGNNGVLGTTTASGFVGVGGLVSTPGTAAFAGTATVPTAFAGFFTGDVFVNGNFTVNDPTRKHGAIKHPDGSLRLLYSMEATESWMEDFGKGKLANGKGEVKLDADFVAVAHTDDYHVFLTPYGDTSGLHVTGQTASGFTVQESKGGTGNIGFSWRVVAKPKSEHKAERLAKFSVPDIKLASATAAPKVEIASEGKKEPPVGPPSAGTKQG